MIVHVDNIVATKAETHSKIFVLCLMSHEIIAFVNTFDAKIILMRYKVNNFQWEIQIFLVHETKLNGLCLPVK